MKKRNKKEEGLFNLKDPVNILDVNNERLILLISIQKQATYRYILEQSLASGKTEIEIIRKLSAIEIKKFYVAYRKWKQRQSVFIFKAKRKNNKLTVDKKAGICERNRRHYEQGC